MSPDKTIKFLKLLQVKVPISQQRGGWIVGGCPLAPWKHDGGVDKNPSFACKKEPGDAFTTCFSCGWHGSMSDLILEMRQKNQNTPAVSIKWGEALQLIVEAENEVELNLDSPDIEEVLFGVRPQLHVFPNWWLESFAPWFEASWALEYLHARGVSPAVAALLDLRVDTAQKRICFPVRGFKGELLGLHGRAVDENPEMRYRMYLQARKKNPIVWLGEHWVDLTKPILVVEGPFDLASTLRVYRNTVCPLFVNPSVLKLKRMSDCLEWVTLYDRGKGGDAGREKVSKTLGRTHMIQHLHPPEGRKDPGVMTVQELLSTLTPYLALDHVI